MDSTSELAVKPNASACRNRMMGLSLLLSVFVLVGFGLYQFSRQAISYPPGWRDIFHDRDWDRDTISHFLDIPIPDEARNLVVEGQQGLVGSYGIYPKLSFSFDATPESALEFVEHFCEGELHVGYDPFDAMDMSNPVEDAVLIRGKRSIHYSRSEGTPQTIHGNRCARYDERDPERLWIWIEEIALDTSDPDEYKATYHLPFEANSASAEEYYPRAHTIAPFGNQIRLNITGFSDDSHVLSYHTICMETAGLALVWDYFAFNPDAMPTYAGSDVVIYIDDVQQTPARISELGLSLRPTDKDISADMWQYCLNADWEAGTHTMRVVVDPLHGDNLVLDWEFTVLN